jgi:hypothetical protein
MTDIEKIDLLIAAQTSENNFLAMRLMLDVLHFSFEEAFLRLQLREETPLQLSIEIADIRLFFLVDLYSVIDVPPHWGYIRRSIFISEVLQKQYNADSYIDEYLAWELLHRADYDVRDTAEMKEDIQAALPLVKQLFFERYG